MRLVVTLLGVLALLGVLGGVKFAQIMTMVASGKRAAAAGPPPEAVGTARATEETWERTISDVGTVASSKGVTVSTEVAGTVTRIHFESGKYAKRGDLLVELDTSVEREQLASAVAREDLARTNFQRTEALTRSGALAQAQLDADRAALEGASSDVQAIRARIGLKQIRAPFDGKLGIREVNLGQYLNPGNPITVIETEETLFVDFTTPQELVSALAIGTPVRVTLVAEAGAPRQGTIAAIEPAVDPTTRTVRVRARIPSNDPTIRPGMFVRVSVILPQRERVISVPVTAISHASYGDSVFIVEDKPANAPGMRTTPAGQPVKVVRQQFVRTSDTRGDFVAVVEGVKAGEEVVTSGAFKLRNGSPVVVDNANQPKPEIAPHPQNR